VRCSEAVYETLEEVVSDSRNAFQLQPGKNFLHADFLPAMSELPLKVKTPFEKQGGKPLADKTPLCALRVTFSERIPPM
jgi:hypothetical protein